MQHDPDLTGRQWSHWRRYGARVSNASGRSPRRRLRLNAFTMNVVSHIVQGQWTRSDTRQREYHSLDPWVELAQLLKRGCFDAIFLADVVGAYDVYRGDRDAAVRNAVQFPANDPTALIPAMALVTEHLGFAFTLSVLQEH